jgi:phenylalanyl-tRNA synthetase beta chain
VPHLVAVVFSRDGDGSAGLFELKRLAECILPGCETAAAPARAFEHPERTVALQAGGQPIGRLFELHPSLGVEGRAAIVDLDLLSTLRLDTPSLRYEPLLRFPSSAFDLSVVCTLREPVGFIQARLRAAGGTGVQSIDFVRQYIGAPLPPDRKSVSFRLTAGAPDHTLSSEEIGVIRARIIETMLGHGYELRV